MTRHFLKDSDLSPAELGEVLDLADALKADPYSRRPLAGPQTVAVIFDKTSTRTRVSFSAGVAALGGSPLIINPGESQLGHKESIADSARVLERMVAAIVWRTYAQSGLEEMAAHSRVPVVNALSDDYHPCQLLADLQTIREHRHTGSGNGLSGLTLAYFGDGANNMAHSYLLGGATAGMHVRIGTPGSHQPRPDILERAAAHATAQGGSVAVTRTRMPYAATVAPGITALGGWSGHGVMLSHFCGRLYAEHVAGGPDRLSLLRELQLPAFPGGRRLRAPLLFLAMTWFSLRDRV